MTLREVFAALWRRKWVIVAATLLAAIVAGVYLARMTPNYTSSTTIRLSPLASQASFTGQLGGVPVDADLSIIDSAVILDPAAQAIGLPDGGLSGAVTYSVPPTASTSYATSLVITATGRTPEQAQERASAVAASLGSYLDAQVAATVKTLEAQLQTATEQAVQYQAQSVQTPGDAVVANNLSQALSRMSALNASLATVQSAGPSASTVSPAPPGASTNPSLVIVVSVALLCGILAGAGIALLRDHFDDRIRSDEDLEALTGVTLLARLAKDRAVARSREPLPAASPRRTALSEGIRSLRTSLQVLLPEGKGVLVVTSVEPGDGKTFLSANLALSWSRAGRKVILVGGDLRRPQLDTYFPQDDESRGLSALLLDGAEDGEAPSEQRIVEQLETTSYRGLRILRSGSEAVDPADLLAGASLGAIIRVLSRKADIVVIDSPPALALADASELAAFADGVVVLTTAGRTKRELVGATVGSLQANGAHVFGMIVNRANVRLPKTYGSYYGVASRSDPRRISPAEAAGVRRERTIAAEPARTDVVGPDGSDDVTSSEASVDGRASDSGWEASTEGESRLSEGRAGSPDDTDAAVSASDPLAGIDGSRRSGRVVERRGDHE